MHARVLGGDDSGGRVFERQAFRGGHSEQFGGFEFQVLDQAGTNINALAAATYGMVGAGNASPRLAGLFSSFTTNDPQLTVEIDRPSVACLRCVVVTVCATRVRPAGWPQIDRAATRPGWRAPSPPEGR